MMSPKGFLLCIATMLLFGNDYTTGLQVKIVAPRSAFNKAEGVTVNVQYTNDGKETMRINKWCLPDGPLQDPLFKVTCDGTPVAYIGPIVKRRAPTIDDTVSVAPGQSKVSAVQLSSAYNMSKTGAYAIQYDMPTDRVLYTPAQTSRSTNQPIPSNSQSAVESNSVQLQVEGRPTNEPEIGNITKPQSRAAGPYFVSCASSTISSGQSAFIAARSYADSSLNYLTYTRPAATNRYKTWFGTYLATNWNTVKAHFQNIRNVFYYQTVTLSCACTISNAYAYVYPSRPYTVYLCPVFWRAPLTGTDSKAGTLIHEISHFTVVAATQDYVYGQTGCRNLANTYPSRAIMNADSHEYFSENSPALA